MLWEATSGTQDKGNVHFLLNVVDLEFVLVGIRQYSNMNWGYVYGYRDKPCARNFKRQCV